MPLVLRASTLAGDPVKNSAGQDLGKIEDVVIDVSSGTVAYAVTSFGGGFLGTGGKLFAIPWSVLKLNEEQNEFVLDVPREILEQAEGFDKNNWPDMADPLFRERIYAYWTRPGYHRDPPTSIPPAR